MAARICVFVIPLLRVSCTGAYNNGYPNGGGYNNGGQSNGIGGNAYGDDSSHYNYPGQTTNAGVPVATGAEANAINTAAAQLAAAEAAAGISPTPPINAVLQSTTGSWRGSSQASSGSDPLTSSYGTRASSYGSSDNSFNSYKHRSFQWSSSGSGSGSGWLYPWDYKNFPWEAPYWIWWQYFMTIFCVCCWGFCCCCLFSSLLSHICPKSSRQRQRANAGRQHHHHHHHHHDDDEDEETDTDGSEDLEDTPKRSSAQGSVSSGRPSGKQLSYHGSGYNNRVPMGQHHPQHRY